MIDTHIHLVPGVDDGAKDMDTAIQMLRVANNDGVKEMILTPHFNTPLYQNENVIEKYGVLKEYVATNMVDFKMHLGNEIYLSEEDVDAIKTGKAYTMGNTRYLLLELPVYQFYPFHEMMIRDLQENGYRIVLAHVERYQIFKNQPQMLEDLVKRGIYCQITASYIVDKKTRKKAFKLIKDGLAHIVASDGHNLDKRPPVMKMAYEIVYKAFGSRCADLLFIENPRAMIMDSVLGDFNIGQKKKLQLF
ncbi:tyrosine-protein phosphatase [Acetobacterium sp.]|uniref:tyrosine-protein phosphatase n=1 Tax=Acetobacterium sp. TaxID=1872094 RepID=UPI003593FACC